MNSTNRHRGFRATQQGFMAKSEDVPTLYIYDEIGPAWWGLIDAATVIEALDSFDWNVREINVRINSPGGDVFEASAIYNALRRHPADITIDVDSLAASAASVIAMAGDRIRIAENGMFMVHKAWTIALGNADELRETAEILDKVDGTIKDTYVARTRQDAETVDEWLAAESWFSAKEAVEVGLADEIGEQLNIAAQLEPDRFKNTPKQFLDELKLETPSEREEERNFALDTVAAKIRLTRARMGV